MKKAPAGADAFVICARTDGAARVLVAIIPVASNHVGVGPVPAEIGLRRVGDDSGPARGQERAEHDTTDELPVIVAVVPIAHIGLIVPVFVPVNYCCSCCSALTARRLAISHMSFGRAKIGWELAGLKKGADRSRAAIIIQPPKQQVRGGET